MLTHAARHPESEQVALERPGAPAQMSLSGTLATPLDVVQRVTRIRVRLRVLGAARHRAHAALVSRLDDEREGLLVELERLDRRAYRAEAL